MIPIRSIRLALLAPLIFFIHVAAFSQVNLIRDKLLNTDELLIVAHRAAHQNYPENSLEAIEEAIALGVDMVEIDVRVSSDGIVYLMHDQTIDRTTTGTGDIEKLSSSDLKNVRLLFKEVDSGIAIPTLEEALRLTKGRIMVDLDLKTDKIEEVMEVVREMDMLDEVLFFDSDWSILRKIKAAMPEAYLMPRLYKTNQIRKAYRKLDPVVVHIDPGFNTRETMQKASKYDVRTWINSLGELDKELQLNPNSSQKTELLENGASMVQTDLPELWVNYRNSGKTKSL
ncbi:glycerophosphodiester phosphodiesterase family protein [Algoriphagus halophytocola]|uniref:Glycerophosphodiester phosphodiesterase family protein n=1 Tax=Algoriphagus halophytocola TaxID=2991499 RepID=A0ABY6MJD7_9BACT|nr:glycerophosphodiester phosphodiesterase family protein [Algoriphagus sp. TR-M5]UZD23903.1 glycerophosphodiester phosphodiesterase family protein [Algoriphagus sp. TR-M5]